MAELCSPSASCLSSLKGQLTQLPDLERGLCTIYHKKVGSIIFLTEVEKGAFSTDVPPSELIPNNFSSWLLLNKELWS